MKVVSWRELSVPHQQLVIAVPALLTFVFINAKVYQEVHSKYIIQTHPPQPYLKVSESTRPFHA